MWWYSNKILVFFFAFSGWSTLLAQNCLLSISGNISDTHTKEPIAYANVFIQETGTGAVTDTLGNFKIEHLCAGVYHLTISHIGCSSSKEYITLTKDTLILVYLNHHNEVFNEVVITDHKQPESLEEVSEITAKTINENSNQNLANMIASISGVSVKKNGNSIGKPIIHGLYGNRVTILNNGIVQSGQQWGADHSPEIDPLVANKITVIKGVGALTYQGSSLGGVILIEPQTIQNDPHLHGEARYYFESNGLGNGAHFSLQQKTPFLGWKAQLTAKKRGDNKTADYYLRNTGNQELNGALQLEKSISTKWKMDAYLSTFNTELGILRGSHIGNITDLQEALTRPVPFYTQDNFSYAIDAPSQKVNHHLAKVHSKYFITNNQWVDFSYAAQIDQRKEFDVRRGNKTDLPALSLHQITHFYEGKYGAEFAHNITVKAGIQHTKINNTNVPETGILPLIPDYISYTTGGFATLSKKWNQWQAEMGVRIDAITQNVAAISTTIPREVIRYENSFSNLSTSGGLTYTTSFDWRFSVNSGYASRNPAVNELYSNGLHQGVGGIEEGDPNLKPEYAFKTTLSAKGHLLKNWSVEILGYYQHIEDFIFLNPQDEIRLTIRGAFPVYKYEQSNAQIYGLDVSTNYEVSQNLILKMQYSYLKGDNLGQQIPLINMPPNNINASVNYTFNQVKRIENLTVSLTNSYVFKQTHLWVSQDYAPAPEAYNLVHLKISGEKQFATTRLHTFLRVDNLFNVAYRDYLNRLRYFADDLGINMVIGCQLKF